MIQRSLREWDYLSVSDAGGDHAISRNAADRLLAVARAARIGGADGESILVNGHERLRAQQCVGMLSAPGISLEILPKIDGLDAGVTRHRLVHMLARVFDLDIAGGDIAELGWQKHDLLEIVVRLFCHRLADAVRRGLPRRYIVEEADRSALKGRLLIQRQFTVLAPTPQKLACRYEELSADIALNQIMRAAVTKLRGLAKAPENQRRLHELSFAFADISPVPTAQLPWDHVVLDRTNTAWSTLMGLAKLLLGDRFQTTSAGAAHGHALLFEMNTLFEEYIGRTLRRALCGTGLEVRLQGPQDHALLADDGVRRFATRPDIVVSRQSAPVLIIDTKWKRLKGAIDDPKRGVGQADIYQMMAYAQVYRCSRVMLLYPHHHELGGDEGALSIHRIRGTDDSRLTVASISLSELGDIANRLRTLVFDAVGHGGTAAVAA